MKIELTWNQARRYLNIASDLLNKIPSRGDNVLTTVVKVLAIINTFDQRLGKDNALHSYFETLDAETQTNAQFVDLFFSTALSQTFRVKKLTISEYVDVIIAEDAEIGTLYFIQYNWGSKPEPSTDFWFSKGFKFDVALERLWKVFNRGLHIGLKYDQLKDRPKTLYRPLVFTKDPISGLSEKTLAKTIEAHQRAQANGFSRTYLFYGKQGVGKSTFATRMAQACGKRTLRIDARGFTVAGANDLSFIISGLAPDFVILDDIDRISDMPTALPMLLESLSDLKDRFPSVTCILTANDITAFDPAVIRPGRVDRVVEFKEPDMSERVSILKTYYEEFGINRHNFDELARVTKGLTAAYLREIAIQVKNSDSPQEVLDNIKAMQTLATKAKGKPGKAPGSPGPSPTTKVG